VVLSCPATLFAQGVGKPTITGIPGGFFFEWATPVEITTIQLDKKLTGPFEMMLNAPSAQFVVDIVGKKAESATGLEMAAVLADYWITRGKPEKAVPLYESCLKQIPPDDPRVLLFQNNWAMLYSRVLGQHEEALKVVDSALEVKKDNVVLLDTKGLVLINSGNPAEAVPVLERAVELSCQLPIYCMHLAHALNLDSRTTQARRYFDSVRPQLNEALPGMTKENKAMFDSLQLALPPVGTQ
jgi:tetratricopeptide (TPR) repeat protein